MPELMTLIFNRRKTVKSYYLHSINKSKHDFGYYRDNTCSQDIFCRFIRNISKNRTPLSLEEFIYYFNKKQFPKNATLVTFDDGFKDILDTVLPIIEEYKVPILVFLTTGIIDRVTVPYELLLSESLEKFPEETINNSYAITHKLTKEKQDTYVALTNKMKFMKDRAKHVLTSKISRIDIASSCLSDIYLTWEDIALLNKSPLVTFGSHLVSHAPLTVLSATERAKELIDSKNIIEKKLNCKIKAVSYPYGDYNRSVVNQVIKEGYGFAFTTEDEKIHCDRSDVYLLPRFSQKYIMRYQ